MIKSKRVSWSYISHQFFYYKNLWVRQGIRWIHLHLFILKLDDEITDKWNNFNLKNKRRSRDWISVISGRTSKMYWNVLDNFKQVRTYPNRHKQWLSGRRWRPKCSACTFGKRVATVIELHLPTHVMFYSARQKGYVLQRFCSFYVPEENILIRAPQYLSLIGCASLE